jgi:hypothetical protein
MWTTLDGHNLVLSRCAMRSIARDPERWEIRDLVRTNHRGDLRAALNRSMGQLAANADRRGTFRGKATGRVYDIFWSTAGDWIYQIVTRKGDGNQYWLQAVRQGPVEDLGDLESTYRGTNVTVTWRGPFAQAGFNPSDHFHQGVYVIVNSGGNPHYVGESRYVGQRIAQHIKSKLFLPSHTVYVGRIPGIPPREFVEKAMIRLLQPTKNSQGSKTKKFKMSTAAVITHRAAPGASLPPKVPGTQPLIQGSNEYAHEWLG